MIWSSIINIFIDRISPKYFLILESKTSLVSNRERRDIFHETDEVRFIILLFIIIININSYSKDWTEGQKENEAGLIVIVCLKNRKVDHDSGKTNNIIFAQNQNIADKHSRLEPPCHWSLYTNQCASLSIRGWVREQVLYRSNRKDSYCILWINQYYKLSKTLQKLQLPYVDEFLVGIASLKLDFVTVIKKTHRCSLIHGTLYKCQTISDTSSTSPTGYGGGIFLTGTRDYNPSTL
ncbi:MAG: hypothetical protein EZS28_034170 [Streblomastix strix]|uniref:Uncharacterized protein n=1 Tax=Streblomastix strix TaxID=222440 RepID=A0A5J4UJB8_9EUKA|nr:MAG: hypothetical protein EZS28_034170 [Streblomastix strix]